jgi:hypothetical protein
MDKDGAVGFRVAFLPCGFLNDSEEFHLVAMVCPEVVIKRFPADSTANARTLNESLLGWGNSCLQPLFLPCAMALYLCHGAWKQDSALSDLSSDLSEVHARDVGFVPSVTASFHSANLGGAGGNRTHA